MKLSRVVWPALVGAVMAVAHGASAQEAGEVKADHKFLEPKPGKPVTFYTPGGEVTLYGNWTSRSMSPPRAFRTSPRPAPAR